MSDAAPGTPIEALRSKLAEVSRELAAAQERARIEADALIHEPTPERQRIRNDAEQACELLDLQRARLAKDLRAAEIEQHRGALAKLEAEQAGEQPEVAEIWAEIEAGERQILAALDRHDALMNRTRARTRQARHHHFAGQFGDDTDQPTFYAVLPSPTKLIERLGQLPARLRRAAGQGRGGT